MHSLVFVVRLLPAPERLQAGKYLDKEQDNQRNIMNTLF